MQLGHEALEADRGPRADLHRMVVDVTKLGKVWHLEVFCCQEFHKLLELVKPEDRLPLGCEHGDTQVEDEEAVSLKKEDLPELVEQGQIWDDTGEEGQEPVGREHLEHKFVLY